MDRDWHCTMNRCHGGVGVGGGAADADADDGDGDDGCCWCAWHRCYCCSFHAIEDALSNHRACGRRLPQLTIYDLDSMRHRPYREYPDRMCRQRHRIETDWPTVRSCMGYRLHRPIHFSIWIPSNCPGWWLCRRRWRHSICRYHNWECNHFSWVAAAMGSCPYRPATWWNHCPDCWSHNNRSMWTSAICSSYWSALSCHCGPHKSPYQSMATVCIPVSAMRCSVHRLDNCAMLMLPRRWQRSRAHLPRPPAGSAPSPIVSTWWMADCHHALYWTSMYSPAEFSAGAAWRIWLSVATTMMPSMWWAPFWRQSMCRQCSGPVRLNILLWPHLRSVFECLRCACMSWHAIVTFRLEIVVQFPNCAFALSIRCSALPLFQLRSPDSWCVHVFSCDIWWPQFYCAHDDGAVDLHPPVTAAKKGNTINIFPLCTVYDVKLATYTGRRWSCWFHNHLIVAAIQIGFDLFANWCIHAAWIAGTHFSLHFERQF